MLVPCKYYKPYMDTLKQLCERFYEFKGCGAGGPLHILLDDDNYDIGSVQFCIDYCIKDLTAKEPDHPEYVNLLGIMICNEYAKMSIEERAVFDGYWNGYSMVCPTNPPARCCRLGECENCDFLDDFYKDMKEKERLA